jgi:hypothetical protein
LPWSEILLVIFMTSPDPSFDSKKSKEQTLQSLQAAGTTAMSAKDHHSFFNPSLVKWLQYMYPDFVKKRLRKKRKSASGTGKRFEG